MDRLADADSATASVATKSTSGTVRRVKQGVVDASRDAGANADAFREQAGEGRDVCFLSDGERNAIGIVWRDGVRKFLASGMWSDLASIAQHVSDAIVTTYQRHILGGVTATGSMAPVLPSTQKQKDREVRPGLQPLVRTGQLLRSLVASARKSR